MLSRIDMICTHVQTSMSAAPTKVDVVMSVPILLVALCVHVTLDMSWILMKQPALVSTDDIELLNITLRIDINECSTSNGGCAGTCTNTVGSYYCTCPSGCTLGSNNHVCNGELYSYKDCLSI